MTAPTTPAGMPEMPPMQLTIAGDDPARGHWYSADQMRAYGQSCYQAGRAAALEQAAQECDALASVEGIAQRCADAIRSRGEP